MCGSQGIATRYSLTADRIGAAQGLHDEGMATNYSQGMATNYSQGMAANYSFQGTATNYSLSGEDPLVHTSAEEDSNEEADPLPSSSQSMSLTTRRKEMAEKDTSDEDEDGHRRTKRGEADGGAGGCIKLVSGGRRRAFHDG